MTHAHATHTNDCLSCEDRLNRLIAEYKTLYGTDFDFNLDNNLNAFFDLTRRFLEIDVTFQAMLDYVAARDKGNLH